MPKDKYKEKRRLLRERINTNIENFNNKTSKELGINNRELEKIEKKITTTLQEKTGGKAKQEDINFALARSLEKYAIQVPGTSVRKDYETRVIPQLQRQQQQQYQPSSSSSSFDWLVIGGFAILVLLLIYVLFL